MKILDRYILTTFVKTFFPLFVIIMFILLLQTIWLFISELAGKDLDFSVIVKFLIYATPRLIPMVLPLTILLTSIMIFGSFAENYEFAAMKSSGISLQRAMRTLSVFILFIGIGAFIFANTVIPQSEKKFINLRKNIVKLKPAMAITPNQFNDLGNINMKVAEKYGDNDQYLRDVIIHKKEARAGNFEVIKSKNGELKGSEDSNLITLILNDGNMYREVQPKSPKKKRKLPFLKTHFKQYTLNLDLSELDNVDIDAQQYSKGYNMLNVFELKNELDTLSVQVNNEVTYTVKDVDRRNGFAGLNRNLKIDTLQTNVVDSISPVRGKFTLDEKLQLYGLAMSNTESIIRKLQTSQSTLKNKRRALNKYEMSLHNKYVLGISCILLFFVGAPLGAIIRKGGMGLPIVIGVFLFLTYHFIGIFSKNSAEGGEIAPFLGSWLSTFIIFPLSIFLTYRAATDQGIINFDPILQPFRDFLQKKKSNREEKRNKRRLDLLKTRLIHVDEFGENFEMFNTYDDEKLKDIVKNFRKYQYDKDFRDLALKILSNRGLTLDQLDTLGILHNVNYERGISVIKSFNLFSILTIALVFLNLLSAFVGSSLFSVLSLLFYLTSYFFSLFYFHEFYKLVKDKNMQKSIGAFIFGLPIYILAYFYFRKQMKEDLKKIL